MEYALVEEETEETEGLPSSPDPPREISHYFDDNSRLIDFMLVYKEPRKGTEKMEKINYYLNELQTTFHLHCEKAATTQTDGYGYGSIEVIDDTGFRYIKVHAPIEVLYNLAEELHMKLPTRPNDISIKRWYEGERWEKLKQYDPFQLRDPKTRRSKKYFVAPFHKERLTEFINHDKPDVFFTPAERSRLVQYMLEKAQFKEGPTDIGVQNLVDTGVFLDAYPLHDGPALKCSLDEPINERQRLHKDWASVKCLFRYQPIDSIREYFGEKVALYFSWLGFYTMFLVPAAIVGVLCFIYGIYWAFVSPAVIEACNDRKNGTEHVYYMCPQCDKQCSYYLLSENCIYARASAVFDNQATLFFAFFMSIWATLYLEFWKRHEVSLAFRWHSRGCERNEQLVRPEYTAAAVVLQENPITHKKEPYIPDSSRFTKILGTFGVVLFFIALVIIAMISVIVYRAAIRIVLITSGNKGVQEQSKIIVTSTAAFINLIFINVLKFMYNRVAVVLTNWENPRTRTQYEDSFTFKMFGFQFCNNYFSIIYVAFFKSETINGGPGNYHYIHAGSARFRLDGCPAQGCFYELTILLVVIMVGQIIISNTVEIFLPTALKWWKNRTEEEKAFAASNWDLSAIGPQSQWEDDYEGKPRDKFSLFWEYLEIVLQYGFVTMFVAAFPLAPFCALINNIAEIRVDAYNHVHNFRRPLAERAEDIGAWYNILATLTSVSVLLNGFVLAFTSELIPRLVYRYKHDLTLKGYVNWSLSSFNVKDFKDESKPLDPTADGIPIQSTCRYPGFHDPSYPYSRSITYWKVFAARLLFVLIFIIFVLFITKAICYIVPDVPRSLQLTNKREKYLNSEADKHHKEKLKENDPNAVCDDIYAIPIDIDGDEEEDTVVEEEEDDEEEMEEDIV